ncbi:hypothetical protein R6U76_18575 [Lysinibacillus capsici]|uniref:hypothetical protein n=1 Tax=Lysinibacillus TaxID=400634 RepID=UPI0025869C37|nr:MULTISPECIES: hypothetical protein [Lysinibacillus]WPK04626.1 hypothetical protein R6U76_18575 [Lysinibacillus capsici]
MYVNAALVGRTKVGKSKFAGMFAKSCGLLEMVFSRSGKDTTDYKVEYSLRKEDNKVSPKVTIRYKEGEGKYQHLDIDLTKDNVKELSRKIDVIHAKYGILGISVYDEFSPFALKVLPDKCNFLRLIDTRGLSGENSLVNIPPVDLYFVILDDANENELIDSLRKIKHLLVGSDVVYLYRDGSRIDDDAEYYEAQEELKSAIVDYEKIFNNIIEDKTLISLSSIFKLHNNVIMYPSLSRNKKITKEFLTDDIPLKLFSDQLKSILLDKLDKEKVIRKVQNLIKEDLETQKLFEKFTLEIVKKLLSTYDFNNELYLTKSKIDALIGTRKMWRTISKDGYNMAENVDTAEQVFKDRLYLIMANVIKDFEKEGLNYDALKELEYMFSYLTFALTGSYTMIVRGYHLEDPSFRTMQGYEALYSHLAENLFSTDEIYNAYVEFYKNTININSNSWDYVVVRKLNHESSYSKVLKEIHELRKNSVLTNVKVDDITEALIIKKFIVQLIAAYTLLFENFVDILDR